MFLMLPQYCHQRLVRVLVSNLPRAMYMPDLLLLTMTMMGIFLFGQEDCAMMEVSGKYKFAFDYYVDIWKKSATFFGLLCIYQVQGVYLNCTKCFFINDTYLPAWRSNVKIVWINVCSRRVASVNENTWDGEALIAKDTCQTTFQSLPETHSTYLDRYFFVVTAFFVFLLLDSLRRQPKFFFRQTLHVPFFLLPLF